MAYVETLIALVWPTIYNNVQTKMH
jgi:hypothetical protein